MDGRRVAVLPATVNGKFRTFSKGHARKYRKSLARNASSSPRLHNPCNHSYNRL